LKQKREVCVRHDLDDVDAFLREGHAVIRIRAWLYLDYHLTRKTRTGPHLNYKRERIVLSSLVDGIKVSGRRWHTQYPTVWKGNPRVTIQAPQVLE
jgi:hypothetical protein